LLNVRFGGYPAVVATKLAVHRGNLGKKDEVVTNVEPPVEGYVIYAKPLYIVMKKQ